MLAKYERRVYRGGALVWAGQYRNLKNLPHWHYECEIIYCNKGQAAISASNKNYELKEGYCFFFPSECIHNITSDENTILTVALYDKKLTTGITDIYDLANPVFKDANSSVLKGLTAILNEYAEKKSFYGQIVNAIITTLVLKIYREHDLIKRETQPLKPTVIRYKKLLSQIDEDTDISFEEAAKIMNMSEAYFSRFFKSMAGMTYTQYLNSIRVERAIDLMMQNNAITSKDLMVQTGFGTLRNFNRVFKEVTGFSPKSLPDTFVPNIRTSMQEDNGMFNPTLKESELLSLKNQKQK